MNDLKAIIAKNLVTLRTQAHLTQLQLAEMLNYSDKAVSKWERGEAIPDLRVLIKLSEIYGISLDDIVKNEKAVAQVQPKKHINGMRTFIVAMSSVLVWFIATWVFMILYFISPTADYAYLVFVVSPLPTAIVLVVFSALWGNKLTNALSSTLLVASCAAVVHVFVWQFAPSFKPIYLIWVAAAVFEILVILWFTFRWYLVKKFKKKPEEKETAEPTEKI